MAYHSHTVRLYRRKRNLCCLFFLLFVGSITCLILALFLPSCTPRVTFISGGTLPDDDLITLQVVGPSSRRLFKWNASEKYLAYLPHSGFHNQRIALENALVLARLLNRTLLMPPARLGKDLISYHKFDDLHRLLIHSGKQGLLHCPRAISRRGVSPSPPSPSPPPECWGYFDYTHVSWDWLFDLSSIAAEQPLFHHETFTYPWLENPPPDAGTFKLRDQTAYDFRFVDHVPAANARPHPRYRTSYPISLLAASDAQLIQLGTLFGSSRLHLTKRRNIAMRTAIRERMAIANPYLRAASLAVANALGGQDTFLAAHVRLSNGPFRALREQTVRSIWYRLVACALNINGSSDSGTEEVYTLERRLVPTDAEFPPPPDLSVSLRVNHARLPTSGSTRLVPVLDAMPPMNMNMNSGSSTVRVIKCAGKPHEESELAPLNVPLFVATDIEEEGDVQDSLAPLRAAFPCMVLLRDLATMEVGTSLLREVRVLDQLVNAEDGVRLGPFLAPLLDAGVAARAWAVVGTEGSTFSTYVEDLLWPREHGRQIVQRG
ncbi:hypothetical protein B0F90DRAFT_1786890 [Multifurca ochricompacta]|uniref:O-fucosyltransferase family protein n=1 Tax=Multifurca ochricompacta TaxID=376703 RepID=A0AAD4QIV0_9AGAM|nr:hypothetical protein B0F90DRAFT_1786890 [Multifurca ochricompacta]